MALDWQPDLILLDVMMPGMDGFECCRRLKGDPTTLHIPVVMVTALGEPGERLRGLKSGADDFLTKPVEYETLMARVRSLIRLKRLLDEWRARGETARAMGLTNESVAPPSVAGARALVIDDWDLGAQTIQDALARDEIVAGRARTGAEAAELKPRSFAARITATVKYAAARVFRRDAQNALQLILVELRHAIDHDRVELRRRVRVVIVGQGPCSPRAARACRKGPPRGHHRARPAPPAHPPGPRSSRRRRTRPLRPRRPPPRDRRPHRARARRRP